MSKRVAASVQCPYCGHQQNVSLFRTLWTEDDENRSMMLNDKINLFICQECKHLERLKYPFLCTNIKFGFAIWYEPYHDPQIDLDALMYRKHMGENSFYARAPRIADWDAFKTKFLEMEVVGSQPGQEPIRSKETQDAFTGFVASLKQTGSPSFRQLETEAKLGNVQAQYALAGAYYNGRGVDRSPSQGAEWLQKAAEQGHISAHCDLGVMYQKGVGVEQDYQATLKWLRMAAEQGDPSAQHNLGSLYAKGFRLKHKWFFNRTAFAFMKATQDFVEAYKWFSLAAANGYSQSLTDRAIIKMRMTTEQISRAEDLAADFLRSMRQT